MRLMIYELAEYERRVFQRLEQEMGIYCQYDSGPLTQESMDQAAGCDGVSILGYSRITGEILKGLKDKGITHLSTRTIGFDHIDVGAAKALGIHVSNARYAPHNVADFTVMMMLILLRKAKISICRALVNDFSLDGLQGRELRSLTVGIVGTGRIGKSVIQNLSGFGCRILASSSHRDTKVSRYAQYVSLDTLYRESDIISLHVPLTKDNYHMIDRTAIDQMKDGVILINTARGGLIDTEDLIEGLEKEKIGGAGIDTLEEEFGVAHFDIGTRILEQRSLLYLKQFPNVVFTQHYAFFTEEATQSMVSCSVEAIVRGVRGEENPYEIR